MRKYMVNVMGKINDKNQQLTILDQLNPVY